jgi:hypothetical protein
MKGTKDHLRCEAYTVEKVYDETTGIIIREDWWNSEIKRSENWHRLDGPAVINRDPTTGIVTHEEWWKNGVPHRADGPAFIYRNPATGKITRQIWYCEGEWIPYRQRPHSPSRPGTAAHADARPRNAL